MSEEMFVCNWSEGLVLVSSLPVWWARSSQELFIWCRGEKTDRTECSLRLALAPIANVCAA